MFLLNSIEILKYYTPDIILAYVVSEIAYAEVEDGNVYAH